MSTEERVSGLTEDARSALADALYQAPHLVDKDGRSFGGYWGDVADELVQLLADEGWTLTLTREDR